LVLTTTFPRWKDDTTPTFIYDLSKRLNEKVDLNVMVLAPHHPRAKEYEVMNNVKVYRFPYFYPKRYQKLCYEGGISPNIKRSLLAKIQVPFIVYFELVNAVKILKKEKINLIHAHWVIPSGFIAIIIKKIYNIPFVVTAHGSDIFNFQGKIPTALKKIILLNANKITVISNTIKNEILSKFYSTLDITIIPMGVDSKLFNSNNRDDSIKKKYNIQGPFLLFVGRLIEKKGIEYLIRSLPEVIKLFPKTKLLIIGTGILETKLKNLVKKLKCDDHIIFTGPIPNNILPKYYATADIFIGPSIRTTDSITGGLGITFVEATLAGCATIGTDIGGIGEISNIIKDKTGILVKQKDSKEISNSIIKLLNNMPLIEKHKRQTRKETVKNFDWKIIAEKFYKIYKEIIRTL